MSTSTNFAVGEPFPLPVLAQADGGMFQVDRNGMLAVTEVGGVLFLLYRIDGIFKDGWGDAPLSLSLVKEELLPDEQSLADPTIHLYLIDTNLKILLAQRTASVPEEFAEIIRRNVHAQKEAPLSALAFQKKVSAIWAEKSAADLRRTASAAHTLPMTLGSAPLH